MSSPRSGGQSEKKIDAVVEGSDSRRIGIVLVRLLPSAVDPTVAHVAIGNANEDVISALVNLITEHHADPEGEGSGNAQQACAVLASLAGVCCHR